MDRRLVLATARAAFTALALAAIGAQLAELAGRGVLNPVNFFSYFTIQSNLIGVASFLVAAAGWRRARSAAMDLFRGAAVVYLTVTLVVFALLLSNTDVDTAVPWVNTVVHQVFPLAVIADWLVDPPDEPITFRRSLWWLVYPLAWVAYTLVRGPIAGWYPYPFIDPANGGYATVAGYVVAILAFGIVLCAIVSAAGRMLGARRTAVA
ncbi:MAG: hypothetical protein A2V85_15370 [Chloroflexi bacterium RBG_16_72_14]|nr:MAG: hypothetical protein A2V85_15370 [Chloroflexi bacterium RBG_16_72_14]